MFAEFLTPLNKDMFMPELLSDERWGRDIHYHFPNEWPTLEGIDLAIIGVKESRGVESNIACNTAPDAIRKQLYSLCRFDYALHIADLGNIEAGATLQDTYIAVQTVCEELISMGIIPIVIGGSQDITYGQFLSYVRMQKPVNIALVNAVIDWDENDTDSLLYKIFTQDSNVLFNYAHLGFQTHYTQPAILELLNKVHFDFYKLSQLRDDTSESACVMRNSDLVSISMRAVRYADAPGHEQAIPNGFMGEEVCLLARYAGISTRVSSFGLYDINPAYDTRHITEQLAAQVIWYFVDGFYHRVFENVTEEDSDYLKYITSNESFNYDLVFWKNIRTNHWWVEVPLSNVQGKRHFEKNVLLPCTYNDYERTKNGDLPERWIKAYQKLN